MKKIMYLFVFITFSYNFIILYTDDIKKFIFLNKYILYCYHTQIIRFLFNIIINQNQFNFEKNKKN